MGLRDYLWRKPASEDMPEIPMGDEEDMAGATPQEYPFQQGLFNAALQNSAKIPAGVKISYSPSTQLPKPEQLSALMKLSGYDPEVAKAARDKEVSDLQALRKMVSISGQPQLDLSPAASYLQSLTGRDIGYKAPQPFDTTISKQAQLSELLGKAESKKIEDAQKLAALVAKLSSKQPGVTISRMNPQQNQIGNKLIPASEVGKISELGSGINAIDDLIQSVKDNKDLLGPLTGKHYNIGVGKDANILGETYAAIRAMYDKEDPRAQQLIQRRETVKQLVGKGLEGGVLRKEDETKYNAIIAALNRDAFVSEEQLGELKRILNNYIERKKSDLSRAGYYTQGFGPAKKSLPATPIKQKPVEGKPTSKDLFK